MAAYEEAHWEHTHVSGKAYGFVVTEHERIAESRIIKQEEAKFSKELSMCMALADNGHDVEFLHGVGRPEGQTFDIRIDGIPADLKFIEEGGGGIPKYTKHAFRDQGAKIVVFRLPAHEKAINDRLTEAYRKYGSEDKIYFYFTDDTRLREIKKMRPIIHRSQSEASDNRPRGVLNPKAKPHCKNNKYFYFKAYHQKKSATSE